MFYFSIHEHWDRKSKSPYKTYIDKNDHKHVVWYENQKSIGLKVALAKDLQLRGLAIWRMGQANESFWRGIDNTLHLTKKPRHSDKRECLGFYFSELKKPVAS